MVIGAAMKAMTQMVVTLLFSIHIDIIIIVYEPRVLSTWPVVPIPNPRALGWLFEAARTVGSAGECLSVPGLMKWGGLGLLSVVRWSRKGTCERERRGEMWRAH